VPTTPLQVLLANPIAVQVDRVLADPAHGPAVLDQWIAQEADLVRLIPEAELYRGVTAHPWLLRLGRRPLMAAIGGMDVDGYALIVETMADVADAVAREVTPPEWQPAMAQALRQMAARIGQDPRAFRWFCRQMDQLKARILAILQTAGPPHSDNPPPSP